MVNFVAGDIASASELRDAIGGFDILANDISVTSSATSQDCPGLAVMVDAVTLMSLVRMSNPPTTSRNLDALAMSPATAMY